MGRKKVPDDKSKRRNRIDVGASAEQIAAWSACAKAAGIPLAQWVRNACEAAENKYNKTLDRINNR